MMNKAILEALEPRTLLSTYTVTKLSDDGSTGTLRWAVAQADASGGTIDFAPSLTAIGAATIDLSGTALDVDCSAGTVTINGPGANLLTIDAQNNSAVFQITPDNGSWLHIVQINDLTITGGNAGWQCGGGISLDNSILEINACTITGNTDNLDNTTGVGGGIAVYDNGDLTIENSTIKSNIAG
jgi:hypothetical protein